MLSRIAKALLVATSLAPILLGYGIVQLGEGKTIKETWSWFAMAVGLVVVAYLMPLVALRRLPVQQLNIKKVKDADKEILTFLITYLLPLAGSVTLKGGPFSLVTLYVFGMIFVAVYHTNAFTFNPLLAIFGYHFFEVETEAGMTYLLISKKVIRQQKIQPWVVLLSEYVYLEGQEPSP